MQVEEKRNVFDEFCHTHFILLDCENFSHFILNFHHAFCSQRIFCTPPKAQQEFWSWQILALPRKYRTLRVYRRHVILLTMLVRGTIHSLLHWKCFLWCLYPACYVKAGMGASNLVCVNIRSFTHKLKPLKLWYSGQSILTIKSSFDERKNKK